MLTLSVLGVHDGTATPFSTQRSRTKTSDKPLVSPGTRSLALLPNTTKRPLADRRAAPEAPFAGPPIVSTLINSVLGVHPATTPPLEMQRSRTNVSPSPGASPMTSVEALLAKP